MKAVTVTITGISPYSQSRMHDEPKLDRETADAYEQRTWRSKCTIDAEGMIVIPAMALKQCLDATAKILGQQIPGRGKSTYTKHFKAGVICESDVPLGVSAAEVASVTINANSDGVRGSGKRVKRVFPIIPQWAGSVRFIVLDDTVVPAVFERHLTEAGKFCGIGRFRPEVGGLNGRFQPSAFAWSEI